MHDNPRTSFYCRDRIRTSINVLGDAYGAGIVYHYVREELEKVDQEAALGSYAHMATVTVLRTCSQAHAEANGPGNEQHHRIRVHSLDKEVPPALRAPHAKSNKGDPENETLM